MAVAQAAKSASSTVAKGSAAAGAALGGLDIVEGSGLDKANAGLSQAAEAAGGVLRGIFGGLPWNMSASEIVDAVGGGGADQAGAIVIDVLIAVV